MQENMNEEWVALFVALMRYPPQVAVPHRARPENPIEAALAIIDAACRFVEFMEPYERFGKSQDETRLAELIRAVLAAQNVCKV